MKKLISTLLLLASFCFLCGGVFAAYAVGDYADSFSVKIRMSPYMKSVTFHVPNVEDSTCISYSDVVLQAEYGSVFSDLESIPSTASFCGFSFVNWYTESTFENVFDNETVISNNLELYAKFVRNNVLYDGISNYFVSESVDHTINSQYVWKVSSQTWGVQYQKAEEDKLNLLSESGIYKTTFANSSWTILRKVGVNCKDLSSWWGNDNAVSYVYGQNEDSGLWANKHYYGGTLSTSGSHIPENENNVMTTYIDYQKSYLGCIRWDPNQSPVELANDSNMPLYYTKPVSVSGYSATNMYLYVWRNNPNDSNEIPSTSWGDGN